MVRDDAAVHPLTSGERGEPSLENGGLTPKELERMRRVVDTMLSAHAMLRDRYRRRANTITLLIIAFSIVASSLAFAAGDSPVAFFFVEARLSRWVAGLSLLTFFLAMAELVFDWRVRAFEHGQAGDRLADLKQRLRAPQVRGEQVVDAEGVGVDYERTMAVIPPIPDSQFAALKARHAYKVELSKAVDSHPGAPVWWLRLLVRLNGARGLTRGQRVAANELESADRGDP